MKITGYSETEFRNNPEIWKEIVAPEDVLRHVAFFRNNPEGSAHHESEFRLKTKGGEWRWMQSRMIGVKDLEGRYIGYTCIDRDITNDKRFEDLLRELIRFQGKPD